MEINATQPAFPISSKQKTSEVTTRTNVEGLTNSKDSQNLTALPKLQKLDVDKFLNNYKNELTEYVSFYHITGFTNPENWSNN